MIHALHIVSNRGFLPWIKQLFNRSDWSSTYIILQYKEKKIFRNCNDNEVEVSADEFGINYIVSLLQERDVVFHYLLDFPKSEIVLRSPSYVFHYWFFFGTEIYHQTNVFKNKLYAPKTKNILSGLPEIKYRYEIRRLYYKVILRSNSPFDSLRKAIPRIKNILWYVDDEIKMISSKIQLPPLLFLQFFDFNSIVPDETAVTNRESRKVLIGNSATIENNHFDVLEVLTRQNPNVHTYSLPMTYGQFKRYRSKVKSSFSEKLKDKVFFLERHLGLNEYYTFINQHPTAIFLHYRQQGLGNILYLLSTGTKIYLSERNVIYHWLKKRGIMVHNFESEFVSDYTNDNLLLDPEWSIINRVQIKKLLTENQNETSLQLIESTIRNKNEIGNR